MNRYLWTFVAVILAAAANIFMEIAKESTKRGGR